MEQACLVSRIQTAPVAFDPDRAEAALTGLPGELRAGAFGDLLRGTAGSSPYLGVLIERRSDWLAQSATQSPESTMQALLDELSHDTTDSQALATLLRQVKARAALLRVPCTKPQVFLTTT